MDVDPHSGQLELGGDAACWAHEFALDRDDIRTREDVRHLVVAFYRDVAMDDLLGPIFATAGLDWNAHHEKLTDFWSWQLLGQPRYDANPLRAHESVHARTPFRGEHYERWLDLFTATVDASFAGPTAELAKGRARRMASALRRLLAGEDAAGDAPVEVLGLRPMPGDAPADR